jgi:hypothetical protein
MHTFIRLFTALSLTLSLASWGVDAAPSRRISKHGHKGPRVLGGSTFRLHQHRNPKYKRTKNSGTVELAKTYKKFNVLLPDELANAIAGIVGRLQGTPDSPATINASDVNFGKYLVSYESILYLLSL